jgi:streptogramin lyase
MNLFFKKVCTVLICTCLFMLSAAHAATISGTVVDQNGNTLTNIQVVFTREAGARGASAVTVFTGEDGRFRFPDDYPERINQSIDIAARGLSFLQIEKIVEADRQSANLTFIMEAVTNQVDTAPASAWLGRIEDREEQAAFIMNCIDCHQVPASEVRDYAAMIDDLHASDPVLARQQSWDSIVKYMNFLSAWEFSRAGRPEGAEIDTDAVYAVENAGAVVNTLTSIFYDRLDHIEGYDWGAPVIATPDTAIWDYEVPEPNAIREAVMLGDPAMLLAADVSANRVVGINVRTGRQQDFEVPTDVLIAPHSLHRGSDGYLWVTPLFNNTVARLNPDNGEWQTWELQTSTGGGVGIHDLSFGSDHELLADEDGRIWFSDIGNRAVGFFDPANGDTQIWNTPVAESRAADSALYGTAAVYGLVMTRDRKEVWYSQLGNGVFGGFNIETEEFIGPFALPNANAGPRRITISEDDIMYMALYGTGQIAEFDIRNREMIAIHDLPDTASAPYSVTWDPVRKVVWVPTSNGDVIYRFDPATRAFGVLPMPREQAFLRMIDIDPATGVLVSSYANIVENVNGPRMAFIVEPGDNAYPEKFSPASASAPVPSE